MTPTPPVPLLILGMHRSGTSALAGTCHALGAEFGPFLIPGGEGNAKGYFEKLDLVLINEKILQGLGTNWYEVDPLPADWQRRDHVRALRDTARAVLMRDFSSAQLWCFKDPRACRLLPFWTDLFAELGWAPRYLLATRHPLEVADSLGRRNGMPLPAALLLWLVYTVEAERYSRGAPRAFTHMNALLEDWRATMRTAAARLDLRWPRDPDAAEADVTAFLSTKLRTHQHDATEDLPAVVALALEGLAAFADGDTARGTAVFDDLGATLDAYRTMFAPFRHEQEALAKQCRVDIAWLERFLGTLT